MGCRVHVIKRQREYGNSEAFNYNIEGFKSMLENLACDVCCQEGCDNFFELSIDDYNRALDVLKSIAKHGSVDWEKLNKKYPIENKYYDKFEDMCDVDDALESIEALGCDVPNMVEIMELFKSQRDKKSDWIQFEMW
jgi:hypothetical protein